MDELVIPQAATDAAFNLAESYDGDESTGLDREIRRIATPIVIAELRRIGETADARHFQPWDLLARADELDGA